MTLQQWADWQGVRVHQTPSGATYVVIPGTVTRQDETCLWELDDYNVSSASGPVVWLVPVPSRNNP